VSYWFQRRHLRCFPLCGGRRRFDEPRQCSRVARRFLSDFTAVSCNQHLARNTQQCPSSGQFAGMESVATCKAQMQRYHVQPIVLFKSTLKAGIIRVKIP
jgi:hypothetical protein